jgi:hypothetical protein
VAYLKGSDVGSSLLYKIIIVVALIVILVLFVQVGKPISDCNKACDKKLVECYNKTGNGYRLVDGLADVNLSGLRFG